MRIVMRQAVLWSLAVSCMLILTTPAAAERNWEFALGGYGGWAFHGDTTFQANQLINVSTGLVEPVDAKGTNLRLEDAGTFGAKLSAWHVPENTALATANRIRNRLDQVYRRCSGWPGHPWIWDISNQWYAGWIHRAIHPS
jgi:hypothetical protein